MGNSAWVRCYVNTSGPYSALHLSHFRKLLFVRNTPPLPFKHVIASRAETTILDEPKNSFFVHEGGGLGCLLESPPCVTRRL